MYRKLAPTYQALMSSDVFQSACDLEITDAITCPDNATARITIVKASQALASSRNVLNDTAWGNLMDALETGTVFDDLNLEACDAAVKNVSRPAQRNFVICRGNTTEHGSQAMQDPHLTLAHGGVADFRGRDNAVWNFLSAQNVSLNVRTRDSTFRLHGSVIHGSFLVDAYILARTKGNRLATISYTASKLNEHNYASDAAMAHCPTLTSVQPATLGPFHRAQCDDVNATMAYSSLTVETGDWTIKISPQPVHDRISGPLRRIDVSLQLNVPEGAMPVAPHGILGQAYDADGLAVSGNQDVYPKTGEEFTTSAMAEGALEGTADDYLMDSPFAFQFPYARFGSARAYPREHSGFRRTSHAQSGATTLTSAAE